MPLSDHTFHIPDDLKDLLRSGQCVAFIGSGVSSGSYPPWYKLVQDLCKECGVVSSDWEGVHENTDTSILLDLSQKAKDSCKKKYYDYLDKIFGKSLGQIDKYKESSDRYFTLLAMSFRSYITINFDPLLFILSKNAKTKCHKDVFPYPYLDRINMSHNRSIHYLHGIIDKENKAYDNSIVFTEDEFDKAYNNGGKCANFLLQVLEFEKVLFIGCRLREPIMKFVFDAYLRNKKLSNIQSTYNNKHETDVLNHYIILDKCYVNSEDVDGKIDEIKTRNLIDKDEDYYHSLGINVIWYPQGDHKQLWKVLDDLAGLELPVIKYQP